MKMKKMFFCVFAVLFVCSTECYSQSFLKKLGKALEDVNTTLEGVNEILDGSKSTGSNKDSKTPNEAEAVVAVVGESDVQVEDTPFKMVTNHPDFKVKVRRCEVSGKTCVIDLILENVGSTDVLIQTGRLFGMIAYDDEANQYVGDPEKKNIQIAVGDVSRWMWSERITLMAGVPLKARIQIDGVAEAATIFKRLQVTVLCDAWNMNRDKKLTFINLPITREGNEF